MLQYGYSYIHFVNVNKWDFFKWEYMYDITLGNTKITMKLCPYILHIVVKSFQRDYFMTFGPLILGNNSDLSIYWCLPFD